MLTIARWSVGHRRLIVAAWIVALVALSGIGHAAGDKFANNLTLPGTDSSHGVDLLKSSFPGAAGDQDQIVFHARNGRLSTAKDRAEVAATIASVARLPHVASVVSPFAQPDAVSRDNKTAFATLTFDEQAGDLPEAATRHVIDAARSHASSAVEVELDGFAISYAQKPSLGAATAIGLLAAIVVLLVTFGSFLAMGLPIATALFGLGSSLAAITVLGHVVDTAFFVPQIAAMIGLGVGIDYALFIVTRYRDAYATHHSADLALEVAMATAGRAVLFAGATVVIALLGMFVLQVSFLYSIGIASSIAVMLMLLGSATLLPALISLGGERLAKRRSFGRHGQRRSPLARWISAVQRHPWSAAITATLVMLILAIPATSLRLGLSDSGTDPTHTTTRKAYDLLSAGFGPGFNGPLQIAVASGDESARSATGQISVALAATPGIASVTPPRFAADGHTAALLAYPTTAPQSATTASLVEHLRADVLGPLASRTGARIHIAGRTATAVDFANTLSDKLPIFIAVVIAISAILLMVVFRSVIVPVQAAAMNLLSIAASMGIITALFQKGWFSGATGFKGGPIDAFIPVVVFAIVFGLSMDYQVFLVSRIREAWLEHDDSSAAVTNGLAASARVVTAAAAVMIVVFLSFVGGDQRVLKMLGASLASAIFLDAVVIRMVLLPAVFELFGRRVWGLPSWLDGRLPKLSIESAIVRQPAGEAGD